MPTEELTPKRLSCNSTVTADAITTENTAEQRMALLVTLDDSKTVCDSAETNASFSRPVPAVGEGSSPHESGASEDWHLQQHTEAIPLQQRYRRALIEAEVVRKTHRMEHDIGEVKENVNQLLRQVNAVEMDRLRAALCRWRSVADFLCGALVRANDTRVLQSSFHRWITASLRHRRKPTAPVATPVASDPELKTMDYTPPCDEEGIASDAQCRAVQTLLSPNVRRRQFPHSSRGETSQRGEIRNEPKEHVRKVHDDMFSEDEEMAAKDSLVYEWRRVLWKLLAAAAVLAILFLIKRMSPRRPLQLRLRSRMM